MHACVYVRKHMYACVYMFCGMHTYMDVHINTLYAVFEPMYMCVCLYIYHEHKRLSGKCCMHSCLFYFYPHYYCYSLCYFTFQPCPGSPCSHFLQSAHGNPLREHSSKVVFSCRPMSAQESVLWLCSGCCALDCLYFSMNAEQRQLRDNPLFPSASSPGTPQAQEFRHSNRPKCYLWCTDFFF